LEEILENAVWLCESGSDQNNFNTIMGILFPYSQGIFFHVQSNTVSAGKTLSHKAN